MLDSKLKAWLLEVNISPSLSSSSPLDKKIKTCLICDTFNLIGVEPYKRREYEEEAELNLRNKLLGFEKAKERRGEQDIKMTKYIRIDGMKWTDGGRITEEDA